MAIKKAEKHQAKLRLALVGPTGSGKTYTALSVSQGLGEKIGVIDTERNSACLYSDKFSFDVEADMHSFAPGQYVEKIREFAAAGYDVLIIDSLSHAWNGEGGALQMVDDAAKRSRSTNSFAAWREVTPEHNRMVEAILAYPGHVIVTVRSKMEYVMEDNAQGKKVPRKIGMQPVQRDGLEYEFTVVGDMDTDHNLVITKSRCSDVADAVISKPGKKLGEKLLKWLNDGTPADETPAADPLENDQTFKQAVTKAMKDRKFTTDGILRAVAGGKAHFEVDEITKTTLEQRKEFLADIAAGKLDKYKAAPAKEPAAA